MTAQTNKRTNSAPQNHHRCTFTTHAGRRCRRLLHDAYSSLCNLHSAPAPEIDCDRQDLTAAFNVSRADLKTAPQINDFLATLATLLIQNRISARRASVLAYTASLILRTLPLIERELDLSAEDIPGGILLDVPRPDRSTPASLEYSAPHTSPEPFAAASQQLETTATPTQSEISNSTTPLGHTPPYPRNAMRNGGEQSKLAPPSTLLPAHLPTG